MLEVEVNIRQLVFRSSVITLSDERQDWQQRETAVFEKFRFLKESEVRRIHLGEFYMKLG
jgi:hypothetical protein